MCRRCWLTGGRGARVREEGGVTPCMNGSCECMSVKLDSPSTVLWSLSYLAHHLVSSVRRPLSSLFLSLSPSRTLSLARSFFLSFIRGFLSLSLTHYRQPPHGALSRSLFFLSDVLSFFTSMAFRTCVLLNPTRCTVTFSLFSLWCTFFFHFDRLQNLRIAFMLACTSSHIADVFLLIDLCCVYNSKFLKEFKLLINEVYWIASTTGPLWVLCSFSFMLPLFGMLLLF